MKDCCLYSLHHLPAQILIASLSVGPEADRRRGRLAEGLLWCYLGCEAVLNLPGYLELARFVAR